MSNANKTEQLVRRCFCKGCGFGPCDKDDSCEGTWRFYACAARAFVRMEQAEKIKKCVGDKRFLELFLIRQSQKLNKAMKAVREGEMRSKRKGKRK